MTVLVLLLCSWSGSTYATLNVFACEPEWKSLVEELGGKKVEAFSATSAFQDSHHIEARPSLNAKMRNADMLIWTRSDLEIAWLPLLLRQAGNKKISKVSLGYFLASEMVDRLEVPEKVDRSMGDVHALGNPHIHLDPHKIMMIARALSERLMNIDAVNREHYEILFSEFSKNWLTAIAAWELSAKDLKGKKAIVYHRNWSYLLDWLGIVEVADLEPKQGVPPTSVYILSL